MLEPAGFRGLSLAEPLTPVVSVCQWEPGGFTPARVSLPGKAVWGGTVALCPVEGVTAPARPVGCRTVRFAGLSPKSSRVVLVPAPCAGVETPW